MDRSRKEKNSEWIKQFSPSSNLRNAGTLWMLDFGFLQETVTFFLPFCFFEMLSNSSRTFLRIKSHKEFLFSSNKTNDFFKVIKNTPRNIFRHFYLIHKKLLHFWEKYLGHFFEILWQNSTSSSVIQWVVFEKSKKLSKVFIKVANFSTWYSFLHS